MKKAAKILLGCVALFVAGSVVGALYAPDEGGRTRRKISRKARKLFYKIDDTVESGRDAIEAIVDNLKDKLETVNDMIARREACSRHEAGKGG